MFFVIDATVFTGPGLHNRVTVLSERSVNLDIELTETDDANDYDSNEGYGFFVREYIEWLCDYDGGISTRRMHRLNDDTFADTEDPYMRARLIDFTNSFYRHWRENEVDMPDEDNARDTVRRSLCHDCTEDGAWEETYAEYDGYGSDDVSDDEDECTPGLVIERRMDILVRNITRSRRRLELENERDEAEGEVLERRFTCRNDCDAFSEQVSEEAQNSSSANIHWLTNKWNSLWGKAPKARIYIDYDLNEGSIHGLAGMEAVSPRQYVDPNVRTPFNETHAAILSDPALTFELHDMVTRVPLYGVQPDAFRAEMLNEVLGTLAGDEYRRRMLNEAVHRQEQLAAHVERHLSARQIRDFVDEAYVRFVARQHARQSPMLSLAAHERLSVGVIGPWGPGRTFGTQTLTLPEGGGNAGTGQVHTINADGGTG